MAFDLLRGSRILDLSTEIAGAYATKLLADAGADVVKVEPDDGDPLRGWSASGAGTGGDGVLFCFLNRGKRSVTGEPGEPHVHELLAGADVVVESGQLDLAAIEQLRAARPSLSVVSISAYGRTGPWADRPATEFTLQAECGAAIQRGMPDREPLQVGGRLGEWVTGVYAGVGALAALRGSRRTGRGEHVDVSMLESMCERLGGMTPLTKSLGGMVRSGPVRSREMPSVEPSADGFVGLCSMTARNFSDLMVLIERSDLQDDAELTSFPGRWRRRDEFWKMLHAWTTQHTTDEIVELASLLRIPAAPVATPETVTAIDHYVERGIFAVDDGGAIAPRVHYQVDGHATRPRGSAPRLAEHRGTIEWPARDEGASDAPEAVALPLAGLKVIDFTSFWAGPSMTHLFAALGADVVHVESIQRPDNFRFVRMGDPPFPDAWWEMSVGFQSMNTGKRGITLDLDDDEGRELLLELAAQADVFVDSYSPRVLENFRITPELLQERNPSIVFVRMPAFGLSGPWRDRSGFAPTIEVATGLAWMTGYADGPPTTLRGPCDPIAGMHGAFAVLAALCERDESGNGHFVESAMVEAALNVAAEMVLEHSADGVALARNGNRGPVAAPQGIYACRGEEQWLALAVADDGQWARLREILGDPGWAHATALDTAAGRHAAHDLLDRCLAEWAADQHLPAVVERLVEQGVPAAAVADGIELDRNPQLLARGYYEPVESPVIGRHLVATLPFRFAGRSEPWVRTAAPTLGQHNREVLGEMAGLDPERLDALEASGVIGTRPVGV